jgi:hypothetical protein
MYYEILSGGGTITWFPLVASRPKRPVFRHPFQRKWSAMLAFGKRLPTPATLSF